MSAKDRIEVGMYVRYQNEISKIFDIDTKTFSEVSFKLDTFCDGMYQSLRLLENCEKSFNIIDLIEKDDYVNGNKVIRVNKKGRFAIIGYGIESTVFENQIKSIVTKEQFEKCSYKIGA